MTGPSSPCVSRPNACDSSPMSGTSSSGSRPVVSTSDRVGMAAARYAEAASGGRELHPEVERDGRAQVASRRPTSGTPSGRRRWPRTRRRRCRRRCPPRPRSLRSCRAAGPLPGAGQPRGGRRPWADADEGAGGALRWPAPPSWAPRSGPPRAVTRRAPGSHDTRCPRATLHASSMARRAFDGCRGWLPSRRSATRRAAEWADEPRCRRRASVLARRVPADERAGTCAARPSPSHRWPRVAALHSEARAGTLQAGPATPSSRTMSGVSIVSNTREPT